VNDNLNPDQFDYRMSHRPAGPGEDVGAQFHRADEVMPDRDWPVVEGTAKASELYGHGDDPNEWGYHPQNRGRA
jgi:hypothetical protein